MESSIIESRLPYLEYIVDLITLNDLSYTSQLKEKFAMLKCLKWDKNPEFFTNKNKLLWVKHQNPIKEENSIVVNSLFEKLMSLYRQAKLKVSQTVLINSHMEAMHIDSSRMTLNTKQEAVCRSYHETMDRIVDALGNQKIHEVNEVKSRLKKVVKNSISVIKDLSYECMTKQSDRMLELISDLKASSLAYSSREPKGKFAYKICIEITFLSLPSITKDVISEYEEELLRDNKEWVIRKMKETCLYQSSTSSVHVFSDNLSYKSVRDIIKSHCSWGIGPKFVNKRADSNLIIDCNATRQLSALNCLSKYRLPELRAVNLINVDKGEVTVRKFLKGSMSWVKSLRLSWKMTHYSIDYVARKLSFVSDQVIDELWLENFEIEFEHLNIILSNFKQLSNIGFSNWSFVGIYPDLELFNVEDSSIKNMSFEFCKVNQKGVSLNDLIKLVVTSPIGETVQAINTWSTLVNIDMLNDMLKENVDHKIETDFMNPMVFMYSL